MIASDVAQISKIFAIKYQSCKIEVIIYCYCVKNFTSTVNKLDLYGATDVISTENNELIILTHEAIYIYDDTDRMNLVEKSVIMIN